MGLDTHATNSIGGPLNDEQRKRFQDAHIRIRTMCLVNNGDEGGFRGKVYANLIKATTGVDLYQEWIDPETVSDMLHNITLAIDDLCALERFFAICAQEEFGLVGSW